MIRYDEHAEFQIERRDIAKSWIEDTIHNPDTTETKGLRKSFLKCLPGRHVVARGNVTERPEFRHYSLF